MIAAAGAAASSLFVSRVAIASSAAALLSEEVTLKSGSIALAGTLVRHPQPAASLVLMQGAFPGERALGLARLIASRGFTVLTYDKRGFGKSGGTAPADNVSVRNLNFLADDAAAAVQWFGRQDRLGRGPLGIYGLSQAGWIAPIAAAKTPGISFIVLWSGPVCTVSEELHFSAFAEGDPDFWAKHSRADVVEHMKRVRYRADDTDPRTSLRRVSIPVLWILGGKDNSVPVYLSIERLTALQREGHSNFEYKLYPDNGHSLDDHHDKDAFDFSIGWIKQHAT